MEKKSNFITLEVKSFDEKKGQVSLYFATWDKDRDNDTLDKKAFQNTFKNNSDNVYWNLDHEDVCGVIDPKSFGVDEKGAFCTGQLLIGDGADDKGTEAGQKAYTMYKAKAIKGHSMEYITQKAIPDTKGGRFLNEVELWGVTSMTKIPANKGATTISVKSMNVDTLTDEEKEFITNTYHKLHSEQMNTKSFISKALLKKAFSETAEEEFVEFKAKFSTADRKKYADSGIALPDGSFPIRNSKDLENAIHDVGRATDSAKAKAHIIKRAKELGLTSQLPDAWDKKSLSTILELKTATGKYLKLRENEKPIDGARVVAYGNPGKLISQDNTEKFNYATSEVEPHTTVKVEHPAGTILYDNGNTVPPAEPTTKFYDSNDIMVHEDDIEKKPRK